ncbi:SGNH/GDSL hydrolase family protein [Acidobacteriota bacterium]
MRILGYPGGAFLPWFPQSDALYEKNAVLQMTSGPIPYVVKTNSLSFRGEEITTEKPPGTLRIAAVGDSITDGFFVDNESTWEYYLEDMLASQLQKHVEVINCAHGGGSIDKQLAILKRFVLPLKPDLVILTFVTNDISDIRGKTRSKLIRGEYPIQRGWLSRFFLTQTAVGEFLFDLVLRIRSSSYRKKQTPEQLASGKLLGESRYTIPGGDDFSKNAQLYLERRQKKDGLVLGRSFDKRTSKLVGNYIFALEEFISTCNTNEIELLFVYFPAYSQIYGLTPARFINNVMKEACLELNTDFLDLTDGFISHGKNNILHFAPVDYHLNPSGNNLFARLVSECVLTMFQIDPRFPMRGY